jgi:bifunctional N-acetylglucosamine-1-phosphate-uridyltransferase/glucosamine-1-phosphate-acetyltransferase GlmU-like protein
VPEAKVLIAAAGSGSRAGLPYPKTLHPVLGKPILLRLFDLLTPIDPRPTVIVSPAGRREIEQCLAAAGRAAELVEQSQPDGMGDAVLRFRAALSFTDTEHVLLVWGDIPCLQHETVAALVDAHFTEGNDFTFASRLVDQAYTVVERAGDGRVTGLTETRETGLPPAPGERDIGLFIFRKAPVFELLAQDLPGSKGGATGEHGFLYLVGHLAWAGYRVAAVPVATELDLISLNRLSDLDALSNVAGEDRGSSGD